MKLAARLEAIRPSPTLALTAKAKALAAQGEDVVSFAAGEPDFDTPEVIKAAAIQALKEGFTKYTATPGIPELRKAICDKLQKDNGLTYAPEQVIVSVGAKHSLYNIFQALLSPGDEVVIFAPYWVSYPDMVKLAGGTPVIVETREEDGFAPDPAALKRALTPRTRAVILNSPSNPTGAVLSRQALEKVAEAVRGHDCLLVTDDIYEKLLYVPGPFVNIANAAPDLMARTVVVNGFSKAYSMTGWRLGYTAGPKVLISAMQSVQDQSTSNPTSIVQRAGVAALREAEPDVARMVAEFKVRRDLIVAGLNAVPGLSCRTPEGAFYVFPDVRGWFGKRYKGQPVEDSARLSEMLLEHCRLAGVPGSAFGTEGFLRLSFATSREVIEKGLGRLREFAQALH
ncbi:MAG TPA: pyridoxal phosphate-dependent aminotransferase [Myxococcaceae bacterium]|nr:pyridoxal phosphate-dependent aminotransferase [Myxococcaceae bacterium]